MGLLKNLEEGMFWKLEKRWRKRSSAAEITEDLKDLAFQEELAVLIDKARQLGARLESLAMAMKEDGWERVQLLDSYKITRTKLLLPGKPIK